MYIYTWNNLCGCEIHTINMIGLLVQWQSQVHYLVSFMPFMPFTLLIAETRRGREREVQAKGFLGIYTLFSVFFFKFPNLILCGCPRIIDLGSILFSKLKVARRNKSSAQRRHVQQRERWLYLFSSSHKGRIRVIDVAVLLQKDAEAGNVALE